MSYSQSYGFSRSHVQMWELDHREGWVLKHWTDAFKLWFWRRLRRLPNGLVSPLGSKKIRPVHPKGNQPWIFIGRTDAEAEAPILWPPDSRNWLIGKDPDAGKDWGQEEKGVTEDETVGWHHSMDMSLGGLWELVMDREGGLECCSSWGHKELDTTERLNSTETVSLNQFSKSS